ncbi:MAG: hypothetical protein WCE30_01640, partial [Mycobacterium sp.]
MASVAAAIAMVGSCTAPQALAEDGVALNGTFTAFSDGQWAATNSSFHDEKSVTQTWTIATTCSTFQDCAGRVTSDLGWSADIVYVSGMWKVSHTVDNWEPCNDGTAISGRQVFTFWPVYPAKPGAFTGFDNTNGPSGACGFNK